MTDILAALLPVIVLLALGVSAAVAGRVCRLSPIVGYLLLGLGAKAAGIDVVANSGTVALLANLGVVFLLFDIGLNFSLARIRHQAADIFDISNSPQEDVLPVQRMQTSSVRVVT